MSLLHLVQLPFVASGLVVGALVGLTGVGGGSLMTPLLVLLFGIHPATAVGTDLLYAGLTKISGSTVHSLHGSIEWRVVRRLALGSAPMAVLTLLALGRFGADHGQANAAITTTLGFALLLTSASLLFRPWLVAKSKPFRKTFRPPDCGCDRGARRGAGRAGVDIVGRGRGHRRDGPAHALSEHADPAHCRLRYRPRRAADADCGFWSLVSGFGRLGAAVVPADRLSPGVAIASHFAGRVPDRALRTLLAATLMLVGGRLAF